MLRRRTVLPREGSCGGDLPDLRASGAHHAPLVSFSAKLR